MIIALCIFAFIGLFFLFILFWGWIGKAEIEEAFKKRGY